MDPPSPLANPPVPSLPAAEVRAAIEAHDWPLATALLDEHQRATMQALAAVDLAASPREPWLDLQQGQCALLAELRAARDAAEASLARLNQDHRGARGWLRELA